MDDKIIRRRAALLSRASEIILTEYTKVLTTSLFQITGTYYKVNVVYHDDWVRVNFVKGKQDSPSSILKACPNPKEALPDTPMGVFQEKGLKITVWRLRIHHNWTADSALVDSAIIARMLGFKNF